MHEAGQKISSHYLYLRRQRTYTVCDYIRATRQLWSSRMKNESFLLVLNTKNPQYELTMSKDLLRYIIRNSEDRLNSML